MRNMEILMLDRLFFVSPISQLSQVSCSCHNPLYLLSGSFSHSISHFSARELGKMPGGAERTQRVRVFLSHTTIRGKPGMTWRVSHESQKKEEISNVP